MLCLAIPDRSKLAGAGRRKVLTRDNVVVVVRRLRRAFFCEPDTSATRQFGTKFKPNDRWSCVSSELSWVRSVPTFPRSGAEVFGAEVSRDTSALVPKCLVAEVSGNRSSGNSTFFSRRCSLSLSLMSVDDSIVLLFPDHLLSQLFLFHFVVVCYRTWRFSVRWFLTLTLT